MKINDPQIFQITQTEERAACLGLQGVSRQTRLTLAPNVLCNLLNLRAGLEKL